MSTLADEIRKQKYDREHPMYWYFDRKTRQAVWRYDLGEKIDIRRKNQGNYFHTEGDCENAYIGRKDKKV